LVEQTWFESLLICASTNGVVKPGERVVIQTSSDDFFDTCHRVRTRELQETNAGITIRHVSRRPASMGVVLAWVARGLWHRWAPPPSCGRMARASHRTEASVHVAGDAWRRVRQGGRNVRERLTNGRVADATRRLRPRGWPVRDWAWML